MAVPTASIRLPRGIVHFRADAECWLRASGILDHGLDGAAAGRRIVHATATRENGIWSAGPRGEPAFDKQSRALTFSDLRKASRRARAPTTPLLHEWAMLWRARRLGISVPEPIAAGVRRGVVLPVSDFLVTERLPGRSLFDALRDLVAMPAGAARAAAAAAGRAVARLHEAGIVFPDLFAKHLFLDPAPGNAWNVGFLDLTSAYCASLPSRRERAGDLGALAASLPFRAPLPLMARFLRAYLGSAGPWSLRDAWRDADRQARRHLLLRRFRRWFLHGADPIHADGAAPRVTLRDDLDGALRTLLLATFRRGLLPAGEVLPHLRAGTGGALLWDPAAPLAKPRRARALHARWRILFLRREISHAGFSPEVARSLRSWLGGALVSAFTLADL